MKTRSAVSLKPNPAGKRLGHQADHQIHLLDVVVVDALDLGRPLPGCPSIPRTWPTDALVEEATELVVARHAALAIAQDVHGRDVELLAVVLDQVLEMPRIVVQPQRARVGHAERVEQVRRR